MSLDSGLMYKVLESSASGKTPLVSTPCECHYAGTLITGEEFDSSYKRGSPTTFAPNQVIKGWTEAMQLMKEGDTWEVRQVEASSRKVHLYIVPNTFQTLICSLSLRSPLRSFTFLLSLLTETVGLAA